MEQTKEYLIKFVAIYLRKSRGDSEDALIKHKKVLTEMCEQNGWKYVFYEEIESGESISNRPIMQRLLNDIENGVFDAVVVLDIDRLGRGDMGDQDRIKKAFMRSETFVITEKDIYNLNDDSDEFVVDMRGFIARQEYKQIVKRLVRGKKVGARMGIWTNGKPPYPYEYENWFDPIKKEMICNKKGLVVNEEKFKTYRYIIDSAVQHKLPPNTIAYELNKKKIPAPKGQYWHGVTVYRLLLDETHLGKIISNKTQGDGHAIKKPNAKPAVRLPQSEWVIVENCHRAVKTQEEHEKLLVFLHREKKSPKRSVAKTLPLTGLIRCARCGHTMMMQYREDRKSPLGIKPCWYKDPIGVKCGNSGGQVQWVMDAIEAQLSEYEIRILEALDKVEDTKAIEEDINLKLSQKKAKEKSLERICEAYEAGAYTISVYKDRSELVQKEIELFKEDIKILELRLKHTQLMTSQERLNYIEEYKKLIRQDDLSHEELNDIYKSIIESIDWERNGKDVFIKANFK